MSKLRLQFKPITNIPFLPVFVQISQSHICLFIYLILIFKSEGSFRTHYMIRVAPRREQMGIQPQLFSLLRSKGSNAGVVGVLNPCSLWTHFVNGGQKPYGKGLLPSAFVLLPFPIKIIIENFIAASNYVIFMEKLRCVYPEYISYDYYNDAPLCWGSRFASDRELN